MADTGSRSTGSRNTGCRSTGHSDAGTGASTGTGADPIETLVTEGLRRRNEVSVAFFEPQYERLAAACRAMAARMAGGGRLLAFGQGAHSTDAQHVAVEFVHPVIVGKKALPALDLSVDFERQLAAHVRPEDVVMGFGPPAGDPAIDRALERAAQAGALTFALPGAVSSDAPSGAPGSYSVAAGSQDPFVHQELIEILYHTLWETVHIFLEHGFLEHGGPQRRAIEGQGVPADAPADVPADGPAAGFLYPFLGGETSPGRDLEVDVATSIRSKVEEDCRLRGSVALASAATIAGACRAMHSRLETGGRLLLFGNGGSATDANDWALDCVAPPQEEYGPLPALSLSAEPGSLTGIANDVGAEMIFSRQLIAQSTERDVAVGISTSGGSTNVLEAFREARKRGLLVVALLGCDGGETLRQRLADYSLVVPCEYVPRIQEVQASVYHLMRDAFEALARE